MKQCRAILVVMTGLSACAGEAPPLPALMSGEMGGDNTTAMEDEGESAGEESSESPSPECGNGVVEPGEECDGASLNGETCESLGNESGPLECSDACTLDTSQCVPAGMVVVPGGEFEMGSTEGQSDEEPIRQVQVDTFYIDRTEVTVSAYQECMDAGECTEPNRGGSCNWMVAGREEHPVNCVDWYQAVVYCRWAGGGTKRLPTEAEWEKAARGTEGRRYPSGDDPGPSCNHVVMNDAAAGGLGCGSDSTMEVGSKSPAGDSPYGVQDMSGNVWEWVSDWHASGYDAEETDNPTGPADGTFRVLRGGSWVNNDTDSFRAAYRNHNTPTSRNRNVGFRCTRTPPAAL